MRYFSKVHIVSVMTVVVTAPCVAMATEVLTTREYVVPKYQATVENGRVLNYNENDILHVNSRGYLERVAPIYNLDEVGDNKYVPVTADAVLNALDDKEDKSNKLDASGSNTIAGNSTSTVKYPSAKAVSQYAVQKPISATAGQVLTYDTGATADSRPVAKYIQVPMASSDPSANGSNVTGVVSIWLQ